MRARVSSTVLFWGVFVLLCGLLAGCGGGDQSGSGGSRDSGAGGGGQQQGGAARENAAPAPKIALGTITSVKPEKRRIALRPSSEVQGSERMAFKVRKNAQITLDDQEAEITDVKEGQQAQITYVIKNEVNRARTVALISGGDAGGGG
jgi:hypothetical protein